MYKKFVFGDLSYRLPIYNYNDYEQMASVLVTLNLNALVDFIQIIHFTCIDLLILLNLYIMV